MSLPRYPEYKPSGATWLGELPAHWETRRVGYLFDERREKVSDRDYPPLSVTKLGVVPQLETAAKTDDGDNRKLVLRGDFVINTRSDRRGSSGLSALDGSVSLINSVLKPRASVRGEFAHHLLRSTDFQEEFYRNGQGIVADLWTTKFSSMKEILLPVPPEPEQVGIATFLDLETAKIDALVAEQERLIELLKEKRQAAISHAVTKGLDPSVPMKDSGVEWFGRIPNHWKVCRIATITSKITNGYVGPTRDILVDEGTRYLQSLHVKNGVIRFDAQYHVTDAWSRAHAKSVLALGDVLVVQTGDIGQVAVVPEEFVGCNCHALIILSPLSELVLGDWLSLTLRGDYGQASLSSIQTGALHPHLNCGNIRDIQVPLPPLHEQARIVAALSGAEENESRILDDSDSAVTLLRERRSALISAAVTGQIDVRNAVPVEAA